MSLFSRFRRVTSSGSYIPEIDGLRFIAIGAVLLLHAHDWSMIDLGITDNGQVAGLRFTDRWLRLGGYGVDIFFVISGFILSLPLLQGARFSYRKYILRRLTRLEPPYILSLLGVAALLVITGKHTWTEVRPELLSSLVYLNNIITPDTLPMVNGVTWSLEIEVQFYLLCPLLGLWARGKRWEPHLYLCLLLLALVEQKWFRPHMLTLLSVGSYFIMGFLLSYAYTHAKGPRLGRLVRDVAAVVSFLLLWVLFGQVRVDRGGAFIWYVLEHVNLFIFFYLVLVEKALGRVFTNPWVTMIGGMCYSIYLLHAVTMGALRRFVASSGWSLGPTTTYYLMMVMLVSGSILVSMLFFLWFEKPFMQRDWPSRWWAALRGRPRALQGVGSRSTVDRGRWS
ncbi:MAG: acyltransferase [Flavobacteriales bacterium]|nr:acyltransferase [Flavobacteriales bacterium]